MSLQQLVDYFNDRFALEQEFNFHPFILQAGSVSGLFGKNRLDSVLAPIRNAYNPQLILGHAAQIATTPNLFHCWQSPESENFLSSEPGQLKSIFNSITNYDRLCRTVHLLNSLSVINESSFLVLNVDPRHILGIEHDHGAYFEEIIVHCGLETRNMVISLTASGVQERHQNKLLKGLNNYRECGYKIALNLGHLVSADKVLNLIRQLEPDYVSVSAPNENYTNLTLNSSLIGALQHLKELLATLGGQIILQDVKQPAQALCATQIGVDLVQGSHYEKKSDLNTRNKLLRHHAVQALLASRESLQS